MNEIKLSLLAPLPLLFRWKKKSSNVFKLKTAAAALVESTRRLPSPCPDVAATAVSMFLSRRMEKREKRSLDQPPVQ